MYWSLSSRSNKGESDLNRKIYISGIGGQGVIFTSRLLAEAALLKGEKVTTSETHGMAVRGGSVISEVKIGNYKTPAILPGFADIFIGMDSKEAIKRLPYLKEDGFLLVNAESFPLKYFYPFSPEAYNNSLLKNLNLIMLGTAASFKVFPFTPEELAEALERITGVKMLETNLKALDFGREIYKKNFKER